MRLSLLLIGFIFSLLLAWLSVRLLKRGWAERRAPELLLSLFFLGAGPLGFAPLIFPLMVPGLAAGLTNALRDVGFLGLLLPPVSIALFTWKVFSPDHGWARTTAILLAVLVVLTNVAQWLAGEAYGVSYWAANVSRMLCYSWASLEALRYHHLSRRRLAIGLGDPVATHRLFLWSLWCGATVAHYLLRLASTGPFAEAAVPYINLVGLLQIVVGLVGPISIWLVFFAPPLYDELIRRLAVPAERPSIPA